MLSRIGRYRVIGELGRGAMGVVYRGLDETLDREVALKVLSAAHATDREARARFLREGRAAGRLQHPNIVTIFELGEHEGDPFMAMELLVGRDLQQAIHEPGADSRTFMTVILQVLAGLGHAHEHGIVHRDIKPSNIFLPRGLSAKITDFGIARLTTSVGTAMTGTGMMVGTPHYMSPEQVKAGHLDARSDLFSTGLILFELVTGEKAYAGDSLVTILFKIVQGPPDFSVIPAAPQWTRLRAVLARSLATEPDHRYPDAASMAHDLKEALDDLADAAASVRTEIAPAFVPPAAATPRPDTWQRAPEFELGVEERSDVDLPAPRAREPRSRIPLVAAGLAILLLVAVAGVVAYRSRAPKPRTATANSALSVGSIRPSPTGTPLPGPTATPRPALPASPAVTATPVPVMSLPPSPIPSAQPSESPRSAPSPEPVIQARTPPSPRPTPATGIPALRVVPRETGLRTDERLARADLLFEQGRFAAALTEARAVLQREPENGEARSIVEDAEVAIAVEKALKNARAAMSKGDREAALLHVKTGLVISATDSRLIALFRELQR